MRIDQHRRRGRRPRIDLAAEWRTLEGNQFRVLIAEPLDGSQVAAELLQAFYRGENLRPLAEWHPKSS